MSEWKITQKLKEKFQTLKKDFDQCVSSKDASLVIWTRYTVAVTLGTTAFMYVCVVLVTGNLIWTDLLTDFLLQLFSFGTAATATMLATWKKIPGGEDFVLDWDIRVYVGITLVSHLVYKVGAADQKGRFPVLVILTVLLSLAAVPIYTNVGKGLISEAEAEEKNEK